jgi:hypothetical protein
MRGRLSVVDLRSASSCDSPSTVDATTTPRGLVDLCPPKSVPTSHVANGAVKGDAARRNMKTATVLRTICTRDHPRVSKTKARLFL